MRLLKKIQTNLPHGLRGIKIAWQKEPQFPWQVGFALCILALAGLLQVGTDDLAILAISLGLALGAEIVNTALEILCDKLHPAYDQEIGKVKDLGAALVIIAGIPAIIATIVILGPRIIASL